MIDPETGARQWNVLLLGGRTSPGVVKLSGDGLKIGWDIQQSTGMSGAITKRINEPLKEFDAEFDLSNELDDLNVSDFDLWDEFQALLKSTVLPGKKPFALPVYHPDLARVGITSVTLGGIGLMQLDGKGGGKIKVDMLEFRPPKPNKPVASTKTEGDKKIDAALKEIDELQKVWQQPDGVPPAKKNVVGDTL